MTDNNTINLDIRNEYPVGDVLGYQQIQIIPDFHPNLQDKTVEITTNNDTQTITPESGYDGFGSVTINTNVSTNNLIEFDRLGYYSTNLNNGITIQNSVNLKSPHKIVTSENSLRIAYYDFDQTPENQRLYVFYIGEDDNNYYIFSIQRLIHDDYPDEHSVSEDVTILYRNIHTMRAYTFTGIHSDETYTPNRIFYNSDSPTTKNYMLPNCYTSRRADGPYYNNYYMYDADWSYEYGWDYILSKSQYKILFE